MGWGPQGLISTEPFKAVVRRPVPSGWADHPNLWLVAADYGTLERTVFGRAGSPPADLADAVAASCAIPNFYHPVRIGRRRYVDGGVCSVSNLDVLAGEDLDLVICLNPSSSRTPNGGPMGAMRAANGRRLGHEARKLRAAGTEVVLVQPNREDLAVMGNNPMSRGRRQEVIETAIQTVGEQLRQPEVATLLAKLPPGQSHKIARPDLPVSDWRDLMNFGGRVRRSA